MARASCVIRLKGYQIDGTSYSCTGSQFRLILQSLVEVVHDCTWFIADVESSPTVSLLASFGIHTPKAIGSIEDLLLLTDQVDQFLWGIFLALPSKNLPVKWTRSFWADDLPFQEQDNCRFEIRAFDADYWEIYTLTPSLLTGLSTQFNSEVECI